MCAWLFLFGCLCVSSHAIASSPRNVCDAINYYAMTNIVGVCIVL